MFVVCDIIEAIAFFSQCSCCMHAVSGKLSCLIRAIAAGIRVGVVAAPGDMAVLACRECDDVCLMNMTIRLNNAHDVLLVVMLDDSLIMSWHACME
jgi:hypothetical protein